MRKSALIGSLLALGATLSADLGRLDLSSKRQQARYARQIAAGQIRNASCVTL